MSLQDDIFDVTDVVEGRPEAIAFARITEAIRNLEDREEEYIQRSKELSNAVVAATRAARAEGWSDGRRKGEDFGRSLVSSQKFVLALICGSAASLIVGMLTGSAICL